jgi:tape measure domain-containing protein
MAVDIGSLALRITANAAPLRAGLSAAQGSLTRFRSAVSSSMSSLGGLGSTVFSGIAAAVNPLTIAVAGLLPAVGGMAAAFRGVQLAADFEQSLIGFEVLLGSAERARALMEELTAFGAATPFELPELQQAARSLLAFGVEAEDIIPTLTAVGDISSGVQAPIGQIAELFGKARVQGRLFQEDINQLTGRGIPIIQELARQFGVAESGVRGLVESGQINFTHLQRAFQDLTASGSRFGGMMERQSQSLHGLWSTLKDAANGVLRTVGQAIIDMFQLKDVVRGLSAAAEGVGDWLRRQKPLFDQLGETIRAAGQAMLAMSRHVVTGLQGPLSDLLTFIGVDFEGGWASWRESIVRGLLTVEFAFTNWGEAVGIAVDTVRLEMVRLQADLAHWAGSWVEDLSPGGWIGSAVDIYTDALGRYYDMIGSGLQAVGATGGGGGGTGQRSGRAETAEERTLRESLEERRGEFARRMEESVNRGVEDFRSRLSQGGFLGEGLRQAAAAAMRLEGPLREAFQAARGVRDAARQTEGALLATGVAAGGLEGLVLSAAGAARAAQEEGRRQMRPDLFTAGALGSVLGGPGGIGGLGGLALAGAGALRAGGREAFMNTSIEPLRPPEAPEALERGSAAVVDAVNAAMRRAQGAGGATHAERTLEEMARLRGLTEREIRELQQIREWLQRVGRLQQGNLEA